MLLTPVEAVEFPSMDMAKARASSWSSFVESVIVNSGPAFDAPEALPEPRDIANALVNSASSSVVKSSLSTAILDASPLVPTSVALVLPAPAGFEDASCLAFSSSNEIRNTRANSGSKFGSTPNSKFPAFAKPGGAPSSP